MPRMLSTAVLLTLLIGCRTSTGISGFYVLQEIDRLAVPRVVSSTVFCDELVLSGTLHFTGGGVFELSIEQSQDCSRNNGSVDTFTTTVTGTVSVDRTQLALYPAGTAVPLTGTSSGGIVDLELPPLPLVSGGPYSGRFVISPL